MTIARTLKPKLFLCVTTLSLSLASGAALAADQNARERTGLFSGLVLGAVVGGPPGAVLGAIGGGLAGRSAAREEQAEARQADVERLQAQLQQAQAQTVAVRAAARAHPAVAVAPPRVPQLSLDSSVQFRTASAALEPHYEAQLRTLAALARQFPMVRVHLLGHADPRGGAAANRQLSHARVQAVRAALVAGGVDAERITFRALGESEPLYGEEDGEGRDFERRVLIRMISAGAQS